MTKQNYILVRTLCVQYEVEVTFFRELDSIGLIEIEQHEREDVISEERIADIEKMIRLHTELNVNIEGIDIIFNLLQKEIDLKEKVQELRNKLQFYEDGE